MKLPGPDHPLQIARAHGRWRVNYENHVIADSAEAVLLREAGAGPVVYFPRADVSMEYLRRTDRTDHCEYKGDAAYYRILMDGIFAQDAAWSYESPYPAAEDLRDRIAFDPAKVELYQVDDPRVAPQETRPDIDEIVQHTDSGGGTSQREHWPANVSEPEED